MKPWNRFSRSVVAAGLVAVGVALLSVGPVHAQVPSPSNSTCPPLVTVAPNGSCCFDVIVRDGLNNPIPGADVVVDFGSCPMTFCPVQPPGITIVGNTVVATTDANGRAQFCICGTFTPPCTADIFASGVLLCQNVPVVNNCEPTPNRKAAWGRLKILYR